MIMGKINSPVSDMFTVFDLEDNFVENIPLEEFTVTLIDPDNTDSASSSQIVFAEIGSGHYKVSFTPLKEGLYYLIVYHNTYFPKGKAGNFQIFTGDFSTIETLVQYIADFEEGRWRMDSNTNQMIFFKGDNNTEIARFNLFDSAGNPTIENVFERRKVPQSGN